MAIFLMHLHNVLRIPSNPVEPLKNLTEFGSWILDRHFPQLKYRCFSGGLWESEGEKKKKKKNLYPWKEFSFPFKATKVQDPVWLTYLCDIMTVVPWCRGHSGVKRQNERVGAGPENKLDMWPMCCCCPPPSAMLIILPIHVCHRTEKAMGSLSISPE